MGYSSTAIISKKKLIISVVVISLGFFMTTLDASVVNIALPVIQDYFRESKGGAEWAITIYLLVISGAVLCFGRLSDLKGRKNLIVIGFCTFTLASILCGLSFNFIMLIIFRGIQAIGGAMIMSSGPAIITDIVPENMRGKAFSVTAISLSLALCAGPVIGGTCTSTFGWKSIFFLNIPFGIIAIALSVWAIPFDKFHENAPFDVKGSILFFVSLSLITLALDMVDFAIGTVVILLPLIIGIILFSIFSIQENRITYPLLKMSLFKNISFTTSNISLFLAFIMQYGFVYITPYFFENHWLMSPSSSGKAMIPISVAMMCTAPISGILADRFKSYKICTIGMLLTSASIFVLCYGLTIRRSMTYWIVCSIIAGIGCGLFQTSNMKQIMESVSAKDRGVASGIRSTIINVGEIMGVSITSAFYSIILNFFNHHAKINTFTSSTYSYSAIFLLLGIVTVLAAILSFLGGNSSHIKLKQNTLNKF